MTKELINEKVFELLEKTGLNWSVNRLPLISKEEGYTTDSYGIFRNDNNVHLGTVGARYIEMQNATLATTLVKASEGINLKMDRGGQLNGGAKIYLQAELPEEKIGNGGVKRMITALNSHDGSTSIAFGSTSTVVICQNTFYRAYGELQKFRHTASAEKRIEIAMHDLRITMEMDQKLMNSFKQLADMPMQDEIVQRVINKMFSIDVDKDTKDVSTRKKNQVIAFGNAVNKSIREQGKTVWALFNGVTYYTNHMQGHTSEEAKTNYIMSGGGYDIANKSFNEIMKWVEENTVKDKVFINSLK